MPNTRSAIQALLALLAVALLTGCGGLPASSPAPTTASVKFAAFQGADAKAPVIDSKATVIIGGVRGTFDGPSGKELTLRGIPFGDQDPPKQPLTVTAPGYKTQSQQVTLSKTSTTYVEASMEKADLALTGTVAGVVRSTTGDPIASALVSFTWGAGGDANMLQGFTDKDGAFIIGGIPIGPAVAEAVATGYLPQQIAIGGIQPDTGGTNADVSFSLLNGSTTVVVRGIVRDLRTEAPLAGASVTVAALPTVTTDSAGRFSVAGVLVGPRTLAVRLSGYDDYDANIDVLPGMGDVVVVISRTSSNPPGVPHTVAGTVTLRGHSDNAGAVVVALDRDRHMEMARYTTAADGRYYLFLPQGRYELQVSFDTHTLTRLLDYPGGGRIIDGVDFTLTVG